MFIVFEGINGVGKTHVINSLTNHLESIGIESKVITSKPTVEQLKAEGLYEVFTENGSEPLSGNDAMKLATLFIRNQNKISGEILEEIESKDKYVIADRWWASTVVYTVLQLVHDQVLNSPDMKVGFEIFVREKIKGNINPKFETWKEEEQFNLFKSYVNSEFKSIISSLIFLTGKKLVMFNKMVYIYNENYKQQLKDRKDKLVSRYETDDLVLKLSYWLYEMFALFLQEEYSIETIEVLINNEVDYVYLGEFIYQLLTNEEVNKEIHPEGESLNKQQEVNEEITGSEGVISGDMGSHNSEENIDQTQQQDIPSGKNMVENEASNVVDQEQENQVENENSKDVLDQPGELIEQPNENEEVPSSDLKQQEQTQKHQPQQNKKPNFKTKYNQ